MQLKKPFFWYDRNIISLALSPFSLITFLINFFKSFSNKKKYNLKTICVGNIYVGGTGKTSLSIEINKILKKKFRTVFIKKNYFSQLDEQNILKLNGKLISHKDRSTCLKIAKE
jgi:Tetraacyldisaccharide-1-P 4''-kinase